MVENKIPDTLIKVEVSNDDYRGKKRYGLEFKNTKTNKIFRLDITNIIDNIESVKIE